MTIGCDNIPFAFVVVVLKQAKKFADTIKLLLVILVVFVGGGQRENELVAGGRRIFGRFGFRQNFGTFRKKLSNHRLDFDLGPIL
jgi:hypothetical protein